MNLKKRIKSVEQQRSSFNNLTADQVYELLKERGRSDPRFDLLLKGDKRMTEDLNLNKDGNSRKRKLNPLEQESVQHTTGSTTS